MRYSNSTFYDRQVEPYVRVATGDYEKDRKEFGRDNAIGFILDSIVLQLQRYFQWCKDGNDRPKNIQRKKNEMLDKYAETVEHL